VGKVPMNPEYIISMDDNEVIMRNYAGQIYKYPQPQIATNKITSN